MKVSEVKRLVRLSEWRSLIIQRSNSGQSIRAWCEENGFTEQQYYYWLRRVRNDALSGNIASPSCNLVKVDMSQMPVSAPSQLEQKSIIIRHGSTTVELPGNTTCDYIVGVLKGLEQ